MDMGECDDVSHCDDATDVRKIADGISSGYHSRSIFLMEVR